ncbi:MAG: preprotein translocase subunit SecA, partial [Deltaproteobacteria bacterium]|nr:preprotein translocase subunit SecA [Deltaproteobacteria bacterium]
MFGLLKKIFGSKNERELKKIRPYMARINELEQGVASLSNDDLARKTIEFRERLARGESLDSLVPEAFAAVRESSRRTTGMRHFDEQMIGGVSLHKGMISEMKTGEGKTLVATLSLYLNALEGRGAHLVTVNDYLARRDAEWMGPIYNLLGMSVGVIVHDLSDRDRKQAYGCDITYGTNNEFGFDYLRDNMKFSLEDYVHRYLTEQESGDKNKQLNYAIVDEVDSILIDEARTPLIISGPSEESSDVYYKVNALIPYLRRDEDYVVDEKSHTATLTEGGVEKIEKRMNIKNLYEGENTEIIHHIHQALKAHTLFKRDVNYLIEDGKVIIIDEFTGRKMPGRRWSDGLHQAVEAKEGLKIEAENQTLATITFQNYFRLYKKLAGMTGTADTEAEEFAKIYNLDVLVIPTHRNMIRTDRDDVVYKSEREKFKAVLAEIKDCHVKGQPALVGTTSVEKSELVSRLLKKDGINHSILNAKNHAAEAKIIAQAGRKGAVTISTNMAGRGTDIILGGNPEMLARAKAESRESDAYREAYEFFRNVCAKEKEEVIAAGGLHIVGTERHEARRIDNQLRGRAGRQGDPGSSKFFLSLDDDLLRIFGSDRIKKIMERFNVQNDEPIVHKWVTRAIENAQKRVEGHNFDIRKSLLEYDDVMNQQRQAVYNLRRKILAGVEVHQMILNAIEEVAYIELDKFCPEGVHPEEWDFEALENELKNTFRLKLDCAVVREDFKAAGDILAGKMAKAYEDKEDGIVAKLVEMRVLQGSQESEELRGEVLKQWREYEKERYLRSIDTLWKNHLLVMDHLKEGVYLEAYAQKDPKLLYKKEGFALFKEMFDRVHL